MHNNNITLWIQKTIESSNSDWILLTLRIDGMQVNACGIAKSPWNSSVIGGLGGIALALEWAVTMLCRKPRFKNLSFAAYWGGEHARSVQPHIHAVCEVPHGCKGDDVVEWLTKYWQHAVRNQFGPSNLRTTLASEKLKSSLGYLRYVSRKEGEMFGYGDAKLIVNKSFKF